MIVPVHFKERSKTEPSSGTYYIVARNGLFLRKKMDWVDAVVPVEKIDVLDDEAVGVKLLLPPLPALVTAKALKFAKAIFDKWQSEVGFLLHHGEEGYQLTVPKQSVDAASIEYSADTRVPDMVCVGTVHSHGRFRAYHSGTDHQDEEDSDGVHITLGSINKYPKFTLSAEVVVNGHRFPVETTWFEGLIERNGLWEIADPTLLEPELPGEWGSQVLLRAP